MKTVWNGIWRANAQSGLAGSQYDADGKCCAWREGAADFLVLPFGFKGVGARRPRARGGGRGRGDAA